jgi:hypothetical protein
MAKIQEIGRYEYKYAVPAYLRAEIVAMAEPFTLPDPHGRPLDDGAMGYDVHSLYFDTPELSDYYERLDGRKIRNRLRLRTYGQPGEKQPLFLENKRKLDQWVIKSRVRICDADAWARTEDDRPWVGLCAAHGSRGIYGARHFSQLMEDGARMPVSVVHYTRAVYVARDRDQPKTRLTMDCEVCAGRVRGPRDLWAPRAVDLVPPGWMVLELKFDGDRPGWMRTLCQRLRLRAIPISKFGLSVNRIWRPEEKRQARFFDPRPFKRALWEAATGSLEACSPEGARP